MQSQEIDKLLKQRAEIPIQSPNAASLAKFVEFPVSFFNGQTSISFPIYEIKLKNITVPITLKYNTAGIRVSEESSWVGLGWALEAGGLISHQVRGLNDLIFGNKEYYGQYFPTTNKTENETYYEGISSKTVSGTKYLPNENGQLEDIMDLFYEQGTSNIDGEPDIYLYNMGKYSGKFIKWNSQFIDLNCNNIKFTQYIGNTHIGDSIIAVTPDGLVYKFKDIEACFSITGTSGAEQGQRMNTSAYYLSEIVAPNGEKVAFHYKTLKQLISENGWESYYPLYANNNSAEQNGYYPSTPSLFEEAYVAKRINSTFRQDEITPKIVRLLAWTLTRKIFLDKIDFPNGAVEFIKSPRLDTYDLKLDRIKILNNLGQTVKIFNFQYDYFDGVMPPYGCDISTATNISASTKYNIPQSFLTKRLKLVSFFEYGNNVTDLITYNFSYNDNIRIPAKTSFSQDFWGYYNGYTNQTMLPSYKLYPSLPGMISTFGEGNFGARITGNRSVNESYNQMGMLKEITLPTGGKSTFEFESNQCINQTGTIYSSSLETRWITATDVGSGFGRAEFAIGSKQTVNISATLGNGGNIPISRAASGQIGLPYDDLPNVFYAVIEKFNSSMNRYELFDTRYFWSAYDQINNPDGYVSTYLNQELQPGKYRLTASFPDNQASKGSLGSTFANLTVSYDTLVVSTNKNLSAGLRTKKITHFDPVSNNSIEKTFQYENGILATMPFFGYSYIYPSIQYTEYMPLTSMGIVHPSEPVKKSILSTNPIINYSYSADGSLVGYKNIKEIISDGSAGKTEYSFLMAEDNISAVGEESTLPGIPSISKLSNGFMKEKTVYNSNNVLLQKTVLENNIKNSKVFWGFKVSPNIDNAGETNCDFNGGTGIIVVSKVPQYDTLTIYMKTFFYPIIQGKVLTKSEYEEIYSPGQLPPVQRSTTFEYNDYCQMISKKIDDSSTGYVTETYKYVPEKASESGGVYTQMKSKNVIDPIIETSTNHKGSIIRQVSNYYQPYSNIFVPSNFQLQFNNNSTETRITYENYDRFGNPVSINKDGTGSVIYLWSYSGQYVVAEIMNSNYANVNSALSSVGLGSIDNLTQNTNPDKLKLDALRNQSILSGAIIKTYKYFPLIGIVEATAPTGVTTYYGYDYSGRLQYMRDNNIKTVKEYEYHYKKN
jgi:hypothetical protein